MSNRRSGELPSSKVNPSVAYEQSTAIQQSTTLTAEEAARLSKLGFTEGVFLNMFQQALVSGTPNHKTLSE